MKKFEIILEDDGGIAVSNPQSIPAYEMYRAANEIVTSLNHVLIADLVVSRIADMLVAKDPVQEAKARIMDSLKERKSDVH